MLKRKKVNLLWCCFILSCSFECKESVTLRMKYLGISLVLH